MLEILKMNVLYPLGGRIGTMAATWLVGYGVQQDHADWVATGVLGVSCVIFDLVTSYLRRRNLVEHLTVWRGSN